MSQLTRTLARTLLVPAALVAVTFAGQSAASASALHHFSTPANAAVAASTSATPQANYVHWRSRWA